MCGFQTTECFKVVKIKRFFPCGGRALNGERAFKRPKTTMEPNQRDRKAKGQTPEKDFQPLSALKDGNDTKSVLGVVPWFHLPHKITARVLNS